jgi:hypothetical protein
LLVIHIQDAAGWGPARVEDQNIQPAVVFVNPIQDVLGRGWVGHIAHDRVDPRSGAFVDRGGGRGESPLPATGDDDPVPGTGETFGGRLPNATSATAYDCDPGVDGGPPQIRSW